MTYPHKLRTLGFILHRHRAAIWDVLQTIICSIVQRLSDVKLPGIAGNLGVSLYAAQTDATGYIDTITDECF